jgi:hypothetical protein
MFRIVHQKYTFIENLYLYFIFDYTFIVPFNILNIILVSLLSQSSSNLSKFWKIKKKLINIHLVLFEVLLDFKPKISLSLLIIIISFTNS